MLTVKSERRRTPEEAYLTLQEVQVIVPSQNIFLEFVHCLADGTIREGAPGYRVTLDNSEASERRPLRARLWDQVWASGDISLGELERVTFKAKLLDDVVEGVRG